VNSIINNGSALKKSLQGVIQERIKFIAEEDVEGNGPLTIMSVTNSLM